MVADGHFHPIISTQFHAHHLFDFQREKIHEVDPLFFRIDCFAFRHIDAFIMALELRKHVPYHPINDGFR